MMNGTRKILTMLALVALMAACAPSPGAGPTSGITTPEPVKQVPVEPSLTPYDAPLLPPKGALEAQRVLAERLGIEVEAVTIRDIRSMEWQDSCLGLGGPAESCLQAITPGYRVTLTFDGQDYIYRTDAEGTQARAENEATGLPSAEAGQPGDGNAAAELPQAVLAAIAGRLNLSPATVKVVEAEQVDWPDACLGIHKAGIACAQMIVPGYRVVVEANGQSYTFRTDLTGNQAVQDAPGVSQGSGSLSFKRQVGSVCGQLRISNEQARISDCEGTPRIVELSPARWSEWQILASSFTGYAQTDDLGEIEFAGTGKRAARPSEQRSLAIWAGLVMDEAEAGQELPENGLALRWHREGGVAGFCDNLTVYTSGFAVASTCKGQEEERGRTRLSAGQLDQLYNWMAQYRGFEVEQKDPAVADAMTIRVEFTGSGAQDAPAEVRAELEKLAGEWFVAAGRAK